MKMERPCSLRNHYFIPGACEIFEFSLPIPLQLYLQGIAATRRNLHTFPACPDFSIKGYKYVFEVSPCFLIKEIHAKKGLTS
jgi:hypothetical protein